MSKSAREKIWGEKASQIEAKLRALDGDLATLILDVVYDDVFERPGLDLRTKELLAVAHLMSVGGEDELKTHIYGALQNGSSLTEIKELILHAAMFIGFPKAVNTMKVLRAVEARETGTP